LHNFVAEWKPDFAVETGRLLRYN
jgi:hypothetical protein